MGIRRVSGSASRCIVVVAVLLLSSPPSLLLLRAVPAPDVDGETNLRARMLARCCCCCCGSDGPARLSSSLTWQGWGRGPSDQGGWLLPLLCAVVIECMDESIDAISMCCMLDAAGWRRAPSNK